MSNPVQFPPNCKWFDFCDMYLHSLEVIDGHVTLYDNLPNVTKQERKERLVAFDNFMNSMWMKKCIEERIDEVWNLD